MMSNSANSVHSTDAQGSSSTASKELIMDGDVKGYNDRAFIRRTIPSFAHSQITQYYRTVDVLLNPPLYQHIINKLMTAISDQSPTVECLASIASRGHLYGSALSALLGLPLICIQKIGKSPGPVLTIDFPMVYSKSETMEIAYDQTVINTVKRKRVAIVDDSIATGGSMAAATQLIETAGGIVVRCVAPFNDNRHKRLATYRNNLQKITTTLYDFKEEEDSDDEE